MTDPAPQNAKTLAAPDELDLGGNFDAALFRRVAETEVSSAPSESSLNPTALLRPLARFMGARLAAEAQASGACFFVLSDNVEDDFQTFGTSGKRHHHFMHGHRYDPMGRIHFVASSFHEACSMDLDCDDPDTVHDWLENNSLIGRPAAWVQRADRSLIWYPNGFGDEQAAVSYRLTDTSSINEAAIDQALDLFHDKTTREPFAHTAFWSDSALHVPCEKTEVALQEALKIALDIHFHNDLVLREVDLPGSTIDFVIHQKGSGRPQPVCALELKVLREKHYNANPKAARTCSGATNTKAVSSGFKQAATAREAHGASMAFMAAFDMRKSDDDTILQTALKKHAALGVNGRRYFMHNSKAAYRSKAHAPGSTAKPRSKPKPKP